MVLTHWVAFLLLPLVAAHDGPCYQHKVPENCDAKHGDSWVCKWNGERCVGTGRDFSAGVEAVSGVSDVSKPAGYVVKKAAKGSSPRMEALPPADDLCSLTADTGPCRSAISRWTWSSKKSSCTRFVYGGCRGNANNFASSSECEAAALAAGCRTGTGGTSSKRKLD